MKEAAITKWNKAREKAAFEAFLKGDNEERDL